MMFTFIAKSTFQISPTTVLAVGCGNTCGKQRIRQGAEKKLMNMDNGCNRQYPEL